MLRVLVPTTAAIVIFIFGMSVSPSVDLVPVQHCSVVCDCHVAVLHILPTRATVAVGLILAKFKPVIVTDVLPVDATFCSPSVKLRTGASNENMPIAVPTKEDIVKAVVGKLVCLHRPRGYVEWAVVAAPGDIQLTVEAELHDVVRQGAWSPMLAVAEA